MKVVVKNGVTHALSRREVERMTQFFPASWNVAVDSIILCQATGDEVLVSHHPKERVLGLYWPREPLPSLTKNTAMEELLISLAAIADLGHLPKKLSKSHRVRYLDSTRSVLGECSVAIEAQLAGAAEAPPKGVAPLS